MDYGFAPAQKDAMAARTRVLFSRRGGTTLVAGKKQTHLQSFVTHLETSAAVTRPIGDALLGAHANSEGQLFMPCFAGQKKSTKFETLEETLADPAKSVAIDDAVIGHTPGDPLTHSVHFKGCNLGKALPLLSKLKEALGGHVKLTAPIHFHGITPSDFGSFEYMCYEFSVAVPKDFATRAAAVAAFEALSTAGTAKHIDASTVPKTVWAPLIPTRIGKRQELQVSVTLGAIYGKQKTLLVPQQFRVDRVPFPHIIKYPTAADIPAPADRHAEFEANLLAFVPNMLGGHPFPRWQRLGYASFADFIAGYTWTFKPSKNLLMCTGTRTLYTVVFPVLDPATGHLIHNFHRATSSSPPSVTTGLVESDTRLFATV